MKGEYMYDGDGKRIAKTEWIEDLQEYHTKIYVYSGLQVLYEKNITTGKEAAFIYGPTERIAKKVNGLTDYYHTDHLGSTRLITNENGNPVSEISYEPFGKAVITGDKESYLYTGKEKDSTGLYYFGARYYDPEIGRWITRDPMKGKIDSPQTLNRYMYCMNNPINFFDPMGLLSFHNVKTGTVIRQTQKGVKITFQYGGEEFTLIVEEDDWTLIDPEGEETVLVQDGTVMNPFAAGFLGGFNSPADISKGGFGSEVGPFQEYQDAYNYALILGMSKDDAEDWAKGYLIGYSLGLYAQQIYDIFKNAWN
jgi:RHS repeat-associated protein